MYKRQGLMLGIETEKSAAEIVQGCLERGVLVLTAKSKVRLLRRSISAGTI